MVEYRYTIFGSGDVLLETAGTPRGALPVLPRIGLGLELPEAFDRITWYGRGPGESYVDSKEAARFGLWRTTVDAIQPPYVYPQENGNRTDVAWAAFTNLRGDGLFAQGLPSLDWSIHRHTIRDLDDAKHPVELPRRDYLSLQLDWKQNGLGTASCGPGVLPAYELKPEPFRFTLRLRGARADAMSFAAWARHRPE